MIFYVFFLNVIQSVGKYKSQEITISLSPFSKNKRNGKVSFCFPRAEQIIEVPLAIFLWFMIKDLLFKEHPFDFCNIP